VGEEKGGMDCPPIRGGKGKKRRTLVFFWEGGKGGQVRCAFGEKKEESMKFYTSPGGKTDEL